MTDTEKLRKLISESGLKLEYIAKQLDITRFSLQKKLENITEFKASEIQRMCEVLKIEDAELKEQIFFAQNVDLKSTGEEVEI